MNIKIIKEKSQDYNAHVAFAYKGNLKSCLELSKENSELVEKFLETKEFDGSKEKHESLDAIVDGKVSKLVFIGLGEKENLNKNAIRVAVYQAFKGLKGKVLVNLEGEVPAKEIAESIVFSKYEFIKYMNEKEADELEVEVLATEVPEGFEEGKVLAEATNYTRDLINEPANVIYPETLADEAVKLGKEHGFEVEISEEDKIKELGMEAFLSVGRAAEKRPRLIVMRYNGNPDSDKKLGLVGKGLTYDTGGLSLKPSTSMDTMKTDMGGAATVLGAMAAIAKMKLKQNVVAVIAACENSIGPDAYRPGDIIGSMAGKTIEVLNTDAEGRITLADAVYYIEHKEGVSEIVDVATLTGAAVIALGSFSTAVLTTKDEMYFRLEDAAKEADERVWALPMFPEYREQLKSNIADIKNIGGREAGTITGGMFVADFVTNVPWLHLDIAGSSRLDREHQYFKPGGTGKMVRTLYHYIKNTTK